VLTSVPAPYPGGMFNVPSGMFIIPSGIAAPQVSRPAVSLTSLLGSPSAVLFGFILLLAVGLVITPAVFGDATRRAAALAVLDRLVRLARPGTAVGGPEADTRAAVDADSENAAAESAADVEGDDRAGPVSP
jgi:hypothetical protein